ncbi:hypothetical protein [Saccharopolyspora hattusasensis]
MEPDAFTWIAVPAAGQVQEVGDLAVAVIAQQPPGSALVDDPGE